MSTKSFPVEMVIKAVDEATAPLRKVGKEVRGLTANLGSIGKQLSSAVTVPLTALGAGGVVAFTAFEKELSNIGTLIDTNVESLDAIGSGILEIGKRVPVGIGELGAALREARSSGVSAADQFGILENSAKLAVVGLGTTEQAIDLVTSAINSFGLKGAEAERVYDLLFKTTDTGKATIEQLARGFGSVAPTVANAGIQLDEYLASVAALTTTGLPANEAHTQLRAVIAGLTRDTKLSSAVFRKFGVRDMKGLIKQSGGLVPALNKINQVLGKSDQKWLQLVGSTEALNAIIGLTGNQAEAFNAALGGMRGPPGGMLNAFAKQLSTTDAQMKLVKNDLNEIAIAIGRDLVPLIKSFIPHLRALSKWWTSLDIDTQKTIVSFGLFAAAMGPVLTGIAKIATGAKWLAGTKLAGWAAGWVKYLWMMRASIMAGLLPSLGAAATAVWGFTAALLANPITWVVAGIAALAGAAYLIYKHWDPIKAFFVDLWDTITDAFMRAWEVISPYIEKIGSVLAMTPTGWAINKGIELFSGDDAAPTLDAASAAPGGRGGDARVQVDFSNLPAGARVTADPRNTAELDLSAGYSLVTP